jgi:hypothetical protein
LCQFLNQKKSGEQIAITIMLTFACFKKVDIYEPEPHQDDVAPQHWFNLKCRPGKVLTK